jgi:hypothetical protein
LTIFSYNIGIFVKNLPNNPLNINSLPFVFNKIAGLTAIEQQQQEAHQAVSLFNAIQAANPYFIGLQINWKPINLT